MKKAKITILALAALCLSGCTGNIPTSQSGENSSPTFSQQIRNPESQDSTSDSTIIYNKFRILEDPISDLGLTHEQIIEKRGEEISDTNMGIIFENGVGLYSWKSEDKPQILGSYRGGGCNYIAGFTANKLFEGLAYPVSLDILSDRYGFVPITIT